MANLFSHKLLYDTVKNIMIPDMEEKISVLQLWVNAINNKSITKKTESECEQAFNLDVFHKVLGYSFYPTENYTLEAKGWNEVSGQKADATLGYFNANDIDKNVSLVQVAVEIKDANTPLTKSQRREWNLSPIQQWFKYKPQYNNCKRVLVTNFVEVRLFKNTQLDYEVWNLVDLVNPAHDYQNFKVFWYLLNAKHLIAPIGMESVTEKLLSAVRIQSEQITKKFYQEYKALRLELINDIRSKNPEVSLDIVLQKSQKVIDRIVFVHFCEDFWLLPDGKLAEVIQYSQSLVGVSVWQILSGFFEAVNSGSAKLGIPNGYNWWLFHEDKELNGLKIWDNICQKFVDLWKYDFQEELSVNILGHIFEQSISDLEDLRIDMLGTEVETWELGESTKSNKRKKDGIFYTPEYIVDYIVRNSLGKYLEEQFEVIEKKHLKNEKKMSDKVYQEKQKLIYGDYKQVLENITVLDPACGSGAFLVKVFDYLLAEHKRVGEALGMWSLFDNESTYKSILQKNIYGVDLNAESVEITKLSLWLKTAEKGKKLADLDNNIKCGNSLIDDRTVAGDKAFDWKTEFADIMNAWWFDVVVGNPPYGAKLDEQSKEYCKLNYSNVHTRTIETFNYFISKSESLINSNWFLSFIVPNNLLFQNEYKKTRLFLLEKNKLYLAINLWDSVFEDATVPSCMFFIQKKNEKDYNILYGDSRFTEQKNNLNTSIIYDNKEILKNPWAILWTNSNYKKIIDKIAKKSFLINDIADEVASWISTWWDKIFRISEKDTENLHLEKNILKKCLVWGDIWKYYLNHQWDVLIYTNRNLEIEKFPQIKSYLERFKEKLSSRSESKLGLPWFSMNRQRYPQLFEEDKIILRQTSDSIIATYDKDWFYVLDSILVLKIKPEYKNIHYKFILSILNSKVNNFIYKNYTQEEWRTFAQVKPINVRKLFIPKLSEQDQQPFIEKADQMLTMNKSLHEKIDFTLRFLQSKFTIDKPSAKLQKFRELDFVGFVKALGLKKLPLDAEAELMRYFEKEKADILILKSQINAIDTQIDEMVFDLYWLTADERKVVLDA